jgi:uncharacterized protein YndB with AHSA1/START domain
METKVDLRRVFDAPAHRVFEAWTRPEQIARWFGPKGFTVHSAEADPRPGGVFRMCMRSPEGKDYWVRGAYREVVPNERLVIACTADDDKGVKRLDEVHRRELHRARRQDDADAACRRERAERGGRGDAEGNEAGLERDRAAARRPLEGELIMQRSDHG